MGVCYNKLFHLLIDKNLKAKQLIDDTGISGNIITRIRRNQYVSLESIEKICRYLNCTPNDIFEFEGGSNESN